MLLSYARYTLLHCFFLGVLLKLIEATLLVWCLFCRLCLLKRFNIMSILVLIQQFYWNFVWSYSLSLCFWCHIQLFSIFSPVSPVVTSFCDLSSLESSSMCSVHLLNLLLLTHRQSLHRQSLVSYLAGWTACRWGCHLGWYISILASPLCMIQLRNVFRSLNNIYKSNQMIILKYRYSNSPTILSLHCEETLQTLEKHICKNVNSKHLS